MTESSRPPQSSYFFLPKLRDGDGTQSGIDIKPGASGIWDQQSEIAFQHVASSLEVPSAGRDVKSVSSIPDMWARPLSMEMALHNRKYPIRGQMIEQWQGMLAAIALAEVRGFDLKAELIELEPLKEEDIFARSLFELLPSERNSLYSLNGKHSWQDLHVFLWNNQPVGMSTPSTLVCPSEEGNWTGLPWWSGGRLRSPVHPVDHLNASEKAQLRAWLEAIRLELSQQNLPRPEPINEISGLLREFQVQLGDAATQTLKPSTASRFFGVELRPLRSLGVPIQAIPQESSVKLIPSAVKTPSQDLLIIPEPQQVVREWGVPAQSIWIHGATNLAALKAEEIQNSGVFPRWNVQCLREQDIFAPELHFMVQAKAFPGGIMPQGSDALAEIYDGKTITPLLPLNRLLLEHLTPEDLAAMLQVKRVDTTLGAQVQFILDLQLTGVNAQPGGTTYRISKTYTLKKENALAEVPVVELWPNFRAATWKEYYAFYYDPALETFQIDLPHVKENYVFKGIGSFHLPTLSMSDANSNCQIAQLSEFPTFIDCRGRNQQSLGLILLKTPPEVGTAIGNPWTVGVDFGTSFTNAYVERNGNVSPLKLDALHYPVTDSKIEVRQQALQEYFIFNIMELPLSTLLTTRGGRGEGKSEMSGILDGRIYIPRDISTFKPDVDDWIRMNLKWAPDTLTYNRQFLKHLILQITAQAASQNVQQIQWAISYPSAFSKSDRNTYARNWRNLTQALEESTGIRQICPTMDNPRYYRTESLAVAHYFADYEIPGRKSRLDLAVNGTCIDVGGGTSDISIWEETQLIHQCSVQLAGRDLFSQFMQANPGCLERLFRINMEKWGRLQGSQFYVKLDLFMRRESEGWLRNRRDMVAEEQEFQGLLQLIALGVSGLYYYVGLILKTLYAEGKYKTPEITPVFLAGNGCRLLNWLAEGGEFNRHSEVNDLFSAMLSQASGFADLHVPSALSPLPKDEAACGLVMADSQLKDMDRYQDDPLIAGEAYEVNGKTFDWNTRMQMSGTLDNWTIPQLAQLNSFLNGFHQTLQDKRIEGIPGFENYQVSEDPEQNSDLWRETSRELKRMLLTLKGNVDDVRVEPPFILGLKALLQVLGRRWADKWK
jgi:hypothetical protein